MTINQDNFTLRLLKNEPPIGYHITGAALGSCVNWKMALIGGIVIPQSYAILLTGCEYLSDYLKSKQVKVVENTNLTQIQERLPELQKNLEQLRTEETSITRLFQETFNAIGRDCIQKDGTLSSEGKKRRQDLANTLSTRTKELDKQTEALMRNVCFMRDELNTCTCYDNNDSELNSKLWEQYTKLYTTVSEFKSTSVSSFSLTSSS